MPFENPYLYNNPFNAQQTPVYMPPSTPDQASVQVPQSQIIRADSSDPNAITNSSSDTTLQVLKKLLEQSQRSRLTGAITDPSQLANSENPLNNTATQSGLNAAQAGIATGSPGYGALAGAGTAGLQMLFKYIHNKYGNTVTPDPNYATQSTPNGSTPISNGIAANNAGFMLRRDPSGLIARSPYTVNEQAPDTAEWGSGQ